MSFLSLFDQTVRSHLEADFVDFEDGFDFGFRKARIGGLGPRIFKKTRASRGVHVEVREEGLKSGAHGHWEETAVRRQRVRGRWKGPSGRGRAGRSNVQSADILRHVR